MSGKIALSYHQQYQHDKLYCPKHTWILDSMPGRYNKETIKSDSQSISQVFNTLTQMPPYFATRKDALNALITTGKLHPELANWLATSLELVPSDATDTLSSGGSTRLKFSFNLKVIDELFDDFCNLDMWDYLDPVENTPKTHSQHSHVHYIMAGKHGGWKEAVVSRMEQIAINRRHVNDTHTDNTAGADVVEGDPGAGGGVTVKFHKMMHVGHLLHMEDMKGTVELIHTHSA